MTREEAIKLLEHISIAYTPTDAYGDYDDPQPYEEAIDMAIEALQAENPKADERIIQSGDLISRADAICEVLVNDGIDNIVDRINVLPSADIPSGEWKLSSEELPQSVGSYIVTCKDEHGRVYVDYDYWTVADRFKYNCSKVTAWIPFPKPYCGADMRKERNK